jgi:4-aminobutyrate--pyruvate transaminase
MRSVFLDTYSGHPAGAAVALEALDIYEEIDLVGYVRSVSTRFLKRCEAIANHALVGDVRGIGLFCGIQLMKDKTSREPFAPEDKVGIRVQDAAHDRDLYLRSTPPNWISFMPPLIINEDEIDEAVDIFKNTLDTVWEEVQ